MIQWVDMKYGDPEIGEVKATKGEKLDYIGMILDYSTKGEVKIDMKYYVKNIRISSKIEKYRYNYDTSK